MLVDDYDPDDARPRYDWLADNGYGGIVYTLREHHDLTLKEFFVEEVGLGNATPGERPGEDADGDDGYQWGIHNDETIEVIQAYLDSQSRRGELAESTINTRRYRLAEYARIYEELHGPVSLTKNLDTVENRSAENDRCMEVFDVFSEQLGTDQSRLKYLGDVQQFYEYLFDFEGAEFNPLKRANRQFRWQLGDPDNQPVDREGMRAIYAEADSIEEKLLVLALGAWGLRPNEVAAAHVSQFVFDELVDFTVTVTCYGQTVVVLIECEGMSIEGVTVAVDGDDMGMTGDDGELRFDLYTRPPVEMCFSHNGVTQTAVYTFTDDKDLVPQGGPEDSYMVFEERKNGPGEVTLLFGVETLQRRIMDLDSSDWNGYLFPSTQSASGHITAKTVNARFKRLAEAAGVTVEQETPTAKMCRRFWYSTYNEAVKEMMEGLEGIAADQGSASTEVVANNYLSEAEERRYRRDSMRRQLESVFAD